MNIRQKLSDLFKRSAPKETSEKKDQMIPLEDMHGYVSLSTKLSNASVSPPSSPVNQKIDNGKEEKFENLTEIYYARYKNYNFPPPQPVDDDENESICSKILSCRR